MIKLSNKAEHATKIKYVDREVIKEIPKIIEAKAPDTIIQYVDREIIREVPVMGETIVMANELDLDPLHSKDKELEEKINNIVNSSNNALSKIATELEMQRRALVAIKMQRDVDRKRRLTLIRKLKREKDAQRREDKRSMIVIVVGLVILSIGLILK